MSEMDCIQRVDQIVRQNIKKCADQKRKQAQHKEQMDYDKHRKTHALRSYSQVIKEANRKAVLKVKEKQKARQKIQRKKEPKQEVVFEDNGQTKKTKLSSSEIKKISSAIEARAEKILHEKQLHKLDEQLAHERKKTKLHQLDSRCRQLVKRNVSVGNLKQTSGEKQQILNEMEDKAMKEIGELDDIIEAIIDGKQQWLGSDQKRYFQKIGVDKKSKIQRASEKLQNERGRDVQDDPQMDLAEVFTQPLFVKSPEELLSLEFIAI